MNRRLAAAALITVAALSAVIAFAAIRAFSGGSSSSTSTTALAQPTATASDTSAPLGGTLTGSSCLSAAEIYQRLRPAVVEIISRTSSNSPFGLPQEGAGSGIVIDDKGNILTNYHVVANATTLEVHFQDGTVVAANTVGRDPGSDLAVVKIDPAGLTLTVAPLGDSSALHVGDPVLAIGNPFNLEGTLTQGIVSGLGRTFSEGGNARPIRNMIQTDAPVNPGNSGGPLINCRGEVVGINTLIENPTGDNVNVGIAFAVSINSAKASLPDMLSGATVQHPWLGIAGEPLTPALASQLNLSVNHGVYVTFASPDGPAAAAGVHGAFASEQQATQSQAPIPGGDVIVSADDKEMKTINDLASYLESSKKPGEKVKLGIVRGSDNLTIEATLAQWPA